MSELSGSESFSQKGEQGFQSDRTLVDWHRDLNGPLAGKSDTILIASGDYWSPTDNDDSDAGDRPVVQQVLPAATDGQAASSKSTPHLLQGGVEKHGKGKGLTAGAAKEDDGKPLQGQADEADNPLKGMTGKEDRGKPLQAEIDDEDSGEMKLAWDKWHNDLLNAISRKVQEEINSRRNSVTVPTFTGSETHTRFAMGAVAGMKFNVDKEGHILNVEVAGPDKVYLPFYDPASPQYDRTLPPAVADPAYNEMIKSVVYSFEGSKLLRFPRGSQRDMSWESGVMNVDTQSSGEVNGHWNDDEVQQHGRRRR